MSDTEELPNPLLACGLPYDELMQLRNKTPLSRVNVSEARAIFDQLHKDGFMIVPRAGRANFAVS